jgi:hypothetical protein
MRPSSPLLFLFLAAPVFAQDNPAQDKPARLDGTITDSQTGAPVVRAHVSLQGNAPDRTSRRYGATSGADGKFTFPDVEPGRYTLQATRTGFVEGMLPKIELKAGDSRSSADMRLIPTGAIVGRVIAPNGEPLLGAAVEVRNAADLVAFRTTDEQGEFRLGGLRPGRYFVRAQWSEPRANGRPEIRTDGTTETHTGTTWYPGVLTRLEATRIEVRPGADSAGVEIRLLQSPFVRVSGHVIGMPASRQERSATLTALHDEEEIPLRLKPDGSFEAWRLTPGAYRLQAQWNTATGQRVRTTSADIELGTANIDDIQLRVVPDLTIAGRLEFEDEQMKRIDSPYRVQRMVNLVRIGGVQAGRDVVESNIEDDNTFRLDKVPAGKYRVAINWDDAWIRSMSLGATPIAGALLDVHDGSAGAELVVRLSAATGSIGGAVQLDEGDSDDCIVVLTSMDQNFNLRTADINPGGTYSFPHVPPGSYQIVALHEADLEHAGNMVPGFERWLETIDVPAAGKVTKDLKLRTAE